MSSSNERLELATIANAPTITASTIPSALVVQNDDGSTFLRVEADGNVTGDLADRYPEALPALRELGKRITVIMSQPTWRPYAPGASA